MVFDWLGCDFINAGPSYIVGEAPRATPFGLARLSNICLSETYEKSSVFHLLVDCICPKEKEIAGDPCDYSMEVCLGFSKEEGAYDYFSRGGRIILKEEALKLISKTEAEGLIHNVFYNTKEGHGGVCNCCSCCCGVIRAAKEYGTSHTLAKSNFLAVIDPDECTAWGV